MSSDGARATAGSKLGEERAPTHEPEILPGNGSFPQIEVFLSGPDFKECIGVRIHGQVHYLHSTTARMLDFRLQGALDVWNGRLRAAKAADPENSELAALSEA
jgi:hypothetical protein